MSFGDPNNPYGQQPPAQPQQPGQPGYGYPQAPPVGQPYGAGYPAAPMEMPGGVKAARVMLWVVGAFQIIAAIIVFATLDTVKDELDKAGINGSAAESAATAAVVAFAVLGLIFAACAFILAVKFKNGGNAVRVCSIVYGSFIVLGGLFQLPLGIVTLAIGILIIVFVAKADGAAWFKRPRF